MPTIICSYCQYVGSGETHLKRLVDVEEHERTCGENTEQVEDEYELCEIWTEENRLWFAVDSDRTNGKTSLEHAMTYPSFAGYLYEDGIVRPESVIYADPKHNHTAATLEQLKNNVCVECRPTHVVFSKGNSDASAT